MHKVLEGIAGSGRIASAYLFVGPAGSEMREDAFSFSERMGAKKIDVMEMGAKGSSLKIDQVRELQQMVRYGPSAGPYLFAIVRQADALTPEATAAFLKVLEEPPKGVVFVLLVEREDRLPATIASRCQKIIFGEKLLAWGPNPEWDFFYLEVKTVLKKNPLELLELSSRMEKEKERIEELLYNLAYFARYELKNMKMVKTFLDAVKNIKKRANLKLALDTACLQLGAI